MFYILGYIDFLIIVFCLIMTPFIILNKKYCSKFLNFIFLILIFSQLLMYYPGADISPYSYTQSSNLSFQLKFFGFTLSSLISIVVVIFIVLSIISSKKKVSKDLLITFCLVVIVNLINLVVSKSVSSSLDSFVKFVTPFCLLIYFEKYNKDEIVRLSKIVQIINFLLIGQIVFCKIFTGSTSAYNYYYELNEEFFGYYNHPHSFTSLLGVLSIFNIYQINKNKYKVLNLILLCCNVFSMYLTGVRTYIVALFIALVFLAVFSLKNIQLKGIRKYAIFCAILFVFFGVPLISFLGVGRSSISVDVSSGRFERWISNIEYMINNYNLMDFMFGRGTETSYLINKQLTGVYINSLNLFIDLLLDFGIIGGGIMIYSYIYIFLKNMKKNKSIFTIILAIYFLVSSIINSLISYFPTMLMFIICLTIFDEKDSFNKKLTSLEH